MVGEMIKKQGRASLYISCNYSCTINFLVKILLVKLKNLHTSACLRLNYGTTKQKPKMQRLQRWWNLSKLVTNTLLSAGEKQIFRKHCTGGMGNFLLFRGGMIKTSGRVLHGDMSKNEHQGTQLDGQRLALGNQRFLVRVRLPTMCRGELSAVIARLMSKCL